VPASWPDQKHDPARSGCLVTVLPRGFLPQTGTHVPQHRDRRSHAKTDAIDAVRGRTDRAQPRSAGHRQGGRRSRSAESAGRAELAAERIR
jgi:hypothetical protein